jgi:serine/threonine-protein kinase RsbW
MPEQPAGSAGMTYAEPHDLRAVRAFVAERAGALGLAPDRINLLNVAVSELTTNTLQHSGGGGHIRVWTDDGHLFCDVVDGGGPRPLGHAMPPPDALRGRGLAIVELFCDSVQTVAVPGGTMVRLQIKL